MDNLEKAVSDAGVPGDRPEFKAFSEIDMIAHMAQTLFSRALPADITTAQFGVLNRLARLDHLEMVSELADAFLVSQPTMSSTIRKLRDKGYVRLVASNTDQRVKYVVLSAAGKRKRDNITQHLEPLYDDLTSLAPDLDLADILPALNKLRVALEKRV